MHHRIFRAMGGPTYRKLGDNDGHDLQDLSISSIRHVAVIVNQNGLEESGNDIRANHLKIISFLDICLNELQDFLLDSS